MGNQKPQFYGKREIVERNGVRFWDSRVLVEHPWGTFDFRAFKVFLWSFGGLATHKNTLEIFDIFNNKILANFIPRFFLIWALMGEKIQNTAPLTSCSHTFSNLF